MTATLRVFCDGIARWPRADATQRPAPALLGANERRRASDGVLVALDVGAQALADAGCPAADVASVFASAHGDLATTDALCRTLADNPLLLSPTRFHHSVHNAASGYWAIARASHAASTALAAGPYSVAAGLLEAASMCAADGAPVLFVASDTPAVGLLADVNGSRHLLALALLLRPEGGRRGLQITVELGRPEPLAGNPVAAGWALVDALQGTAATACRLPLGPGLMLGVAIDGAASSAA